MKPSRPFSLFALALGLALTTPVHAFFKLQCDHLLISERADPVVVPGAVSGHVHGIYGGNAFDFRMDGDRARKSTCSTCRVAADLSNYWAPTVYFRTVDGKFKSVGQTVGMTIYYLNRPRADYPDEEIVPFPPGFRMQTGNPFLREDPGTEASNSTGFTCLGASPPIPQSKTFPNVNCPNGLRLDITLPMCWDGVNLESADGSHVAYPDGGNSGVCPDSHPKKLLGLFFEIVYNVDEFKNEWYGDRQPFVLSTGDPTGYGLHADFANGWDPEVLQRVIDDKVCMDPHDALGDINKCRPSLGDFFDSRITNGCRVPPRIDEQVFGELDALPGCNPVQYGPHDATPVTGCGVPTTISAPQYPFTDLTASHGYKYVGCGIDPAGTPRTFDGAYTDDDAMTVEMCVEFCSAAGHEYAALEYGHQCFCGDSFYSDDRKPINGLIGSCDMPCAGNNGQVCGAGSAISIYQQCSGSCNNVDLSPP